MGKLLSTQEAVQRELFQITRTIIGQNEQVDANELSGSTSYSVASIQQSGLIRGFNFSASGQTVVTNRLGVMLFSGNPSITVGAAGLSSVNARKCITSVLLPTLNWISLGSSAVAFVETQMPFVTNPTGLFYAAVKNLGSGSYNDQADDQDRLEMTVTIDLRGARK